eukprot:CAMPEP_0113488754 /NCGR_PEP_ID=MMETSP0014_2-20120614/26180_1 /TAXON_ID=2857 /ORGANISM="Nitzschia sp." /LENGTH=416 /DNA_ID=CAMNT_0000382477 /DNA_START=126 /DNA_END=1376 /DNA_ORIENTATION=+ /assembly_acc=CAM_ASM_000159
MLSSFISGRSGSSSSSSSSSSSGSGSPMLNPKTPKGLVGQLSIHGKRRRTTTKSIKPQHHLLSVSSKSRQDDGSQVDDDSSSPSSSLSQATTSTVSEISSETKKKPSDYSRQARRLKITAVFCSAIGILSFAAKYDILPGYGPNNSMIYRDVGATSLCAALAVILVKAITWGYENDYYSSKVGRKLNHTLAAPLYILFFPLFSSADGARFFAGLVTLSNVLRLYLAGKGLAEESSLASVVSRSGDKAEALGGPFIYVCLFQCFIWLFWRSSPVGVVAMTVMAAGDGMADLIGRRWGGSTQWQSVLRGDKNAINGDYDNAKDINDDSKPILYGFGENKSVVGTCAFTVSAFVVTFSLVTWLQFTGCMELPSYLETADIALRILLISIVTSIVELLPVGDDNYTVPLTAAGMAALLLQ